MRHYGQSLHSYFFQNLSLFLKKILVFAAVKFLDVYVLSGSTVEALRSNTCLGVNVHKAIKVTVRNTEWFFPFLDESGDKEYRMVLSLSQKLCEMWIFLRRELSEKNIACAIDCLLLYMLNKRVESLNGAVSGYKIQ